ncbi:MAG: efflux RND transporter permease subunit, partial [Acidobacteriota bacterium]
MKFAGIISRQSRAVLVVVGLLCAAGLYAAIKLPTAIFPNTDFPRIVVTVENGEEPADQMLVSVTQPIEEAMNGIPGVQRIRSTTARGSAEINLFFDWSTDIVLTQQIVQGRIAQLDLPPTAKLTNVSRLTFAVFPVSGYSLVSDKRDTTALREIGSFLIRPRLARLPGVAEVQVVGGKVREFHVEIDPGKLAARNVTIGQVTDAIKNSNLLASPGLLEENHQLELALISGQAVSPDELRGIVVANINGANILVSDIASVGEGSEPNYTIVTADGHDAVLLNILRQPDANTVSVTDEVKAELAAIEKTLPKDITIAPFYDQSIMVSDSIHSVRDSIIIGLILSVIILYAFLRNIGTTLVAVLVIPVTILVTFLAMYLVGLSFDLMTLGGVAAAIGLVIDDAIVVVENIYTHLLHGESRHHAVQKAISEITVPIIGSTITPVVVFLPLTFLTGVTGVFFRSLALTMAVALITSLVLALTLTPVLAERFVHIKGEGKGHEELGKVLSQVIRPYEWLLRHALRNHLVVSIACVAILAVSYLVYTQLGSEFIPEFDEGAFVLDYIAPAGASLNESDRILKHVEEIIKDTPEVESFSRRTGMQLGLSGVTEPNTGDFAVKMKPGRSRTTEAVIDDIRGEIEKSEPTLETEFIGVLSDMIGDLASAPQPVEIKIFSDDRKALEAKAEEIEAAIKTVDGIVDTNAGVIVSGPALTFRIDPQLAAGFGVSAADIAAAVETALTGTTTSIILQHGRPVNVRVTFPPGARNSLETLRAFQIRSLTGAQFRLDQVATVEYDKGQTEINRDGLRLTDSVTARVTGTDLGTAIRQIKTQLASNVKLPAGMTVEYGGLYA